jgi:hypothetical protein
VKRALAVVLALVALVAPLAFGGTPALADSRVDVTNDRGGDRADVTYQTRLTIAGAGFQNVPGGFGGVYVLFGWVDDPRGGSWRPSQGGLTGRDYRYIPDAENTQDNKGYLRFVAFPGGSTAGEAAAVLSASGGFTVDMTIPGPVFESVDREGRVSEVDCREVTCGVITIGAHGVKNARNETFTPVPFGTVYAVAPTGGPSQAPATEVPATPTETAGTTPTTTPTRTPPTSATPRVSTGAAALVVDRATAVGGHAMTFSARGFTAGEQVVATLDDGVAALGPMVAGASGEIAGVLQLPADLGVGTHELRLTGAASGTEVSELFPVAAGPDPAAHAPTEAVAEHDDATPMVFLGVAGTALLLAGVGWVVVRRRARATPQAVT